MCGRCTFQPTEEFYERFHIVNRLDGLVARYNIAPGQMVPMIISHSPNRVVLMRWGDRWDAPAQGPPVMVEHRDCRHETHAVQTCSHCGGELTARNVRVHDGPGAQAAA